jgi:hypothetical protein
MNILLLILLLLIFMAAVPAWPYNRTWGYAPSGLVGAILLIVIILFLMGRLPV